MGVDTAGFALKGPHDMKDSESTPPATRGEALALDAFSKITTQLVAEQRRGRRWSVFFKSLLALYAGAILVLSVTSAWDSLWAIQVPHAALVRIKGAIDANADAIYANRASLVGSIGVRMDSFGFADAMQRLGIERRLYVAGDHKGALDMFSPVRTEEESHIKKTLAGVHAQFIAAVREGRGKRLKGGEEVFSGLFWSGEEALALGLVDGIGDRRYVLGEVLGMETGIDYTLPLDWAGGIGKWLGGGCKSCFVHRGGRDQAMMSGEGEGIAFDRVWCFK